MKHTTKKGSDTAAIWVRAELLDSNAEPFPKHFKDDGQKKQMVRCVAVTVLLTFFTYAPAQVQTTIRTGHPLEGPDKLANNSV